MLRLEAYVQAHRGNADGVVRSLTTLAALARALEHENLLMGQFVRLALENIIVFTTFETLPEVDFTDDQLAELQEAFRGGSLKDGLHEALIGERVFAINAFNELNTVPRPEDLELTLQLSSRVIDNLDQPWPTVLQICDGVDAELAAKASSQLGQLRYPVSAMSFPALGHAATAMAAGEGQRAVADAALAAQRYRLKHGDYPKRLEDLVPEFLPAMPIDPLDGNHIRYALRDGFPVVWSIGIDREDDGGQGKLAYDRELDFVGRLAPAESGDTQDE